VSAAQAGPDSKLVVYAAMAGNLLIAATKLGAAAYTGSSAMLSEGVHSIVDTGNQALLLYGLRRAQRPPDERFAFGYGKEIYFWSFVVALLIFAVGAGISLYEGVRHLLHPNPVQSAYLNYIVLGLSFLFEGISWSIAFKAFRSSAKNQSYVDAVRRGKDPMDFAVLFEDSAALLGIAVAFAGVLLGELTGSPYFDGGASIVIGLILGATAWWLAHETKGLLIGESANREVIAGIRALATGFREVRRVDEVLTMHIGPDYILANISLVFAEGLPRARAYEVLEGLDSRIKAKYPKVQRVFIEPVQKSSSGSHSESHGT
jgi:cation diffusion facilitator family transporter